MSERFTYVGITDESTVCDQCGKEDLRSTIILGVLDADDNVTEMVYFGSSCAARALAKRFGVKTTARKVLDLAKAAQQARKAASRDAVETLTYYGLPLAGEASSEALEAAAKQYADMHRYAAWANPSTDWTGRVLDMLAYRQALVIA